MDMGLNTLNGPFPEDTVHPMKRSEQVIRHPGYYKYGFFLLAQFDPEITGLEHRVKLMSYCVSNLPQSF